MKIAFLSCENALCTLYCETAVLETIPTIEVQYTEVEMAEDKMSKADHGGIPDIATNSSIDFFISYNGADKTWAEWLAWQLEEEGFSIILQRVIVVDEISIGVNFGIPWAKLVQLFI